MITCSDICA